MENTQYENIYSLRVFTREGNKGFVTEMSHHTKNTIYPTENIIYRQPYFFEIDEENSRKLHKGSATEIVHHTKYPTENHYGKPYSMNDFRKLMESDTVTSYYGPYAAKKAYQHKPYDVNPDYEQNLYPRQHPKLKKKSVKDVCYQCGISEYGVKDLSTSKFYETFDTPNFKGNFDGKTYIGGCFKKFLDIGHTYNERGCRHMPPLHGHSFALGRFARLEILLHSKREGPPLCPSIGLYRCLLDFMSVFVILDCAIIHQLNLKYLFYHVSCFL